MRAYKDTKLFLGSFMVSCCMPGCCQGDGMKFEALICFIASRSGGLLMRSRVHCLMTRSDVEG